MYACTHTYKHACICTHTHEHTYVFWLFLRMQLCPGDGLCASLPTSGLSDVMLIAWPQWEYFICGNWQEKKSRVFFPLQRATLPAYHCACTLLLQLHSEFLEGSGYAGHPPAPHGLPVSLCSRFQRVGCVHRTKGEWMKAKERGEQKGT